jgi:hypothetical protein
MPGYIKLINGRDIQAVFALNAATASYATTASYALTAETLLGSVTSASYALTASVLLGSVATASYALTASTSNTAVFAVSASAVKITNNTTTNATYYPTFVSQTSGHTELQVDSSTLTWNPSTNTLTATNFAGNATTATTATSATTATTATSATTAASASSILAASGPAGTYSIPWMSQKTPGIATYLQGDTILQYATSTGQLSATTFNGALTGNATSATSATSASYALTATSASFLNTLSQSLTITGSVNGNVISASIVSSTSSLNLSAGNFFFIQLQNSSTTHINPTNIRPGQTVNIRIQQAGGSPGSVSWPPTVRQPSGSFYTASLTAGAYDIVSLISFDTSNLYLSYVKRLI